MTQEEKQLLFIDLCARLPYEVILHDEYCKKDYKLNSIDENGFINYDIANSITHIKPYLRPMSSMTSKEWLEYCDACVEDEKSWTWARAGKEYKFTPVTYREKFLNSHHFDYRGLIPIGLALEAPEGMYNTQTE